MRARVVEMGVALALHLPRVLFVALRAGVGSGVWGMSVWGEALMTFRVNVGCCWGALLILGR